MKPKMLNLVAGAILAASATFPAKQALAEEKYEMPAGTPFDANPAAENSEARKFMLHGKDPKGREVPRKTIRITNNSDRTIYPIMRDPNSATEAKGSDKGLYDPYDPVNKEYRGYIGYEENGKYYFGLKPGKSILVRVPLVFWNGARMGLGTDGTFLTVGKNESGDGDALQNPLRFRNAAKRSIAPAEKDENPKTKADTITNGVVMWYRADIAEAPNDDTEDQLVEWTIRDHEYLRGIGNNIPDTELVTLINYDVSNVDNLYLPVAMQALDVWVDPQKTTSTDPEANRKGHWEAGKMPEVNGWTGSLDKIEDLQKEIRKFTATPNEYLGEYFGPKRYGWPYYNMPGIENDPKMPLKIPSGANIFAQSPIKAVHSSYKDGKNWQNDKYMLSSGGSNAIGVILGTMGGEKAGDTKVALGSSEPAEKFEFIKNFYKDGLVITGGAAFQEGTEIKGIEGNVVTLSKGLKAPTAGVVATIARPSGDYAAEAMIRLWFSWAEYYRDNWKMNNHQAPSAPVTIKGSMEAQSATIEFKEAHKELVPGMSVDVPVLTDANTEDGKQQGKAVILEVAGDGKSVIVSQVAKAKTSADQVFTFSPPEKLIWTPKEGQPGYPLFNKKFKFSEKDKGGPRDPYKFAQQVYLVMASMNQIGRPNNDSVSKFMQDVVGANMGYIFDPAGKASDDGKMVTSMIRDMIKSVLRGVTDFTDFPDDSTWYPDPKVATGGQPFNVFNLDPFVWFVHVKLGFSGYGFSVDDDTADIGAGGANHLQISVAGSKGLQNLNEWSIQVPYGPVIANSLEYSGPDDKVFAPGSIINVSATPDGNMLITTEGASNMRNNDEVYIDQVETIPAINGKTFKVRHAKKESFELVDLNTGEAVPFSGKYPKRAGRFGPPMKPYLVTGEKLTDIFHRVQDDDALRTFQGTPVKVNGVSHNKDGVPFRVQRKGDSAKGVLILNTELTNADGSLLPKGNYKIEFSAANSKDKKK